MCYVLPRGLGGKCPEAAEVFWDLSDLSDMRLLLPDRTREGQTTDMPFGL